MVPATEIELLANGIVAKGPSLDGFAQNLYRRNGQWYVRSGFGQVVQFDTTLGTPLHDGDPSEYGSANWGYQEHLGSHLLDTNFGHQQVVSIFTARVYTGQTSDEPTVTTPHIRTIFVVRVYDLTTDTSWEEPLHLHTSDQQDDTSTPMWTHHATHESAEVDSHQAYDFEQWIEATPDDTEAWFTEFRGALIFGTPSLGAWYYAPSTFLPFERRRQVNNANRNPYSEPYGESSLFKRIRFVPGHFSAGYDYLDGTTLQAVDLAVYSERTGRIIYALDGTLYLSDEGNPAHVAAGNSIGLIGDEKLTAIAELHGALYAFTASRTYHIVLGGDFVATIGARITVLSDTIGCAGPNLWARMGQSLVWVDRNGVHATNGGLNITTISDDVDRFFKSQLDNPLTNYYAASGATNLVADQPTAEWAFDETRAHLLFWPKLDLLFLAQPSQGMALCWSEQKWSVWNWESVVNLFQPAEGLVDGEGNPVLPTARVGTSRRVQNPWLCADETRLCLVGSIDEHLVTTEPFGNPWVILPSRSAYLLEYGRGGALDRSIDLGRMEDRRTVGGWWDYAVNAGSDGSLARFYIHKGIPLHPRWTYQLSPDQTAAPPSSLDVNRYEDYLFPVTVVPELGVEASLPITGFTLILNFNDDVWRPVLRTLDVARYSGVNTELALEFPPERIFSVGGYAIGLGLVPDPGTFREAQLYDSATGLVDPNGDQIRISFNGDAAAATWGLHPGLGLNLYMHNLLFYIPMRKRRAADDSQDINGDPSWSVPVLVPPRPTLYNGAHVTIVGLPAVNIWRQTMFYEQADNVSAGQDATGTNDIGRRRKDNRAQPVDWLYQSPLIESGKADKVKLRGVALDVRSAGRGDELDSGDQGWDQWPAGLINMIIGADKKDALSQLIDYDGDLSGVPNLNAIEQVTGKEGIRTRLWDGAALNTAAYGSQSLYGDPGVAATGNLLIASEEVSEVQLSDGVRGRQVRVTLFGHMRNAANVLVFERARALVRLLGFSGRQGRSD